MGFPFLELPLTDLQVLQDLVGELELRVYGVAKGVTDELGPRCKPALFPCLPYLFEERKGGPGCLVDASPPHQPSKPYNSIMSVIPISLPPKAGRPRGGTNRARKGKSREGYSPGRVEGF